MDDWKTLLNRYLEGDCPREDLDELRRRTDLPAPARQEIDEVARLAESLAQAFETVSVPEGAPGRALSALAAEPAPSTAPAPKRREPAPPADEENTVVDPELEHGLSAAFGTIPFPEGGLDRLLERLRGEASGEEGDVRAQFGEPGEADAPGTVLEEEIHRRPRWQPPPGLVGPPPDVLAASRDAAEYEKPPEEDEDSPADGKEKDAEEEEPGGS
jgi:hypothetical protein